MSKVEFREGDVVDYRGNCYWICEVRGNRVRLLPMDSVSFDDGAIYELGKAFEVDSSKVTIHVSG